VRGKIAVAKAIYCTARPQLLRRNGDSVYLKEWGINGGPPTSSATSSLYRVQTGWSRLAGQQQHAMVSAAAAQLSRRDWIGHLKKHIYDLAVADHTHTHKETWRKDTHVDCPRWRRNAAICLTGTCETSVERSAHTTTASPSNAT